MDGSSGISAIFNIKHKQREGKEGNGQSKTHPIHGLIAHKDIAVHKTIYRRDLRSTTPFTESWYLLEKQKNNARREFWSRIIGKLSYQPSGLGFITHFQKKNPKQLFGGLNSNLNVNLVLFLLLFPKVIRLYCKWGSVTGKTKPK